MAFIRNKTVNLLNFHYGLLSLASRSGGVFIAAFMLQAGVPAPMVLLAYAGVHTARFFLRPLVLVVGKRVGLRPLVMFGGAFYAVGYLLLPFVDGVGWALLGVVIASAVSDSFYWTSYHAYFAALGDSEHRGHQISFREAVVSVIGIVAPIAGGIVLVTFGPMIAFGATAAIQALCVLPLLGTPNIPVARDVDGAFQASLPGFRLFVADGFTAAGNYLVWSLVLFGALSQSFTAYGGAMAAAALVGAAAGLFMGRNIDLGHGMRAVWLMFGAGVAIILAKTFAGSPPLAIAANVLPALIGSLHTPTLMTAVYNLAKRSPCPLRFHLAAEGGWDVGYVTGLLISAGLLLLGASAHWVIPISLLGMVGLFVMLRRYYATPEAQAAAAAA